MIADPSKLQMEGSDAAIVEQVRAGDNDAFRVLVERHSRRVFAMAYRMTGNETDAEDIVQDTFIKAFNRLAHFESRASFGTWLYRIGANCAVDLLRTRRHRSEMMTSTELDGQDLVDMHPATNPNTDSQVHDREIREHLTAALDRLSDAERSAFVMRHFEDMSIKEIGTVLKLKENATKNTIFRAVRKLRELLQPALGEPL